MAKKMNKLLKKGRQINMPATSDINKSKSREFKTKEL
jgi:hypothetical protein